jgi:hypothetical protein
MRTAFDAHFAFSRGSLYDDAIAKDILRTRNSLKARFTYTVLGDHSALYFTSLERDPAYPGYLAKIFGGLNDGTSANYLLHTKGPAIDGEFYTRVGNFKINQAIKHARRLIAGS